MRIRILAVGSKMPGWVESGCAEYLKRMPRDCPVSFQEVPIAKRQKSTSAERLRQIEGESILRQIPLQEHVVALEVKGRAWSTTDLAKQLANWRELGKDVSLLVGGPDGLSDDCRQRANQQWSLSPLTLPHPLVRVILAEQLYRAWSVTQGHPYHRE